MMPGHESWMLGGWLVLLIVWLLPFLLLYFAMIRRLTGGPPSARELLDRAFAQGTLSRDEYLKKRADLAGG